MLAVVVTAGGHCVQTLNEQLLTHPGRRQSKKLILSTEVDQNS